MSHAPSYKHRLIAPQHLIIQEKEKKKGFPKKNELIVIDDECAELVFENGKRTLAIHHDPHTLVPVVNVNAEIKNFQSFNVPFNSVIKNTTILMKTQAVLMIKMLLITTITHPCTQLRVMMTFHV